MGFFPRTHYMYFFYNLHFITRHKFKVSCHFLIRLRAIKAILLFVVCVAFLHWWWHGLNKSFVTRQGVCLFSLAFHLFWWWCCHKLIRWTTCLFERFWMHQSTFNHVMSRRTTIWFIWADFWYVVDITVVCVTDTSWKLNERIWQKKKTFILFSDHMSTSLPLCTLSLM